MREEDDTLLQSIGQAGGSSICIHERAVPPEDESAQL
jgi:hypothetical protein